MHSMQTMSADCVLASVKVTRTIALRTVCAISITKKG